MEGKEITFEELLAMEQKGEEICLFCDWANCVVRYRSGPNSYHFMKYRGEEEYAPKEENDDFHRAMFDGLLISRKEYDNY